MEDESIIWPFLIGVWKQPFPGTNLPAQDARDRLFSFKDASRLLHPRDRRHVCRGSGVSPIWSSRAQLQKGQYSHQRLPAGTITDFSYNPRHSITTLLLKTQLSHVCYAGFHLPPVLEEQGPSAENPHGRHQESIPLSLREQHQETSQTLRGL